MKTVSVSLPAFKTLSLEVFAPVTQTQITATVLNSSAILCCFIVKSLGQKKADKALVDNIPPFIYDKIQNLNHVMTFRSLQK